MTDFPNSAEHTPTPWRVEEGTDLIWGACNPNDQSTYGMGYSIVEGKIPGWKPYKPSMEEREANAAFIVKAVNNHDALVKALEDLVFTISTTAIKPGWPLQYLESDVQQARAALAAVKGQS